MTTESKVINNAFLKFASIKNNHSLNNKAVRTNAGSRQDWIACEKIDGTNMSCLIGKNLEWCYRSGIADPKAHRDYITNGKRYESAVEKLVAGLKFESSVQIYGELYGGKWEDKRLKNCQIFDAVEYSPEKHWRIFDIKVDRQSISYDDVIRLCKQCGLLFSPILHRGTFEEMMKLDPNYKSTIPELHGLTSKKPNVSEGYVISTIGPSRSFVKIKSKGFKEERPRKQIVVPSLNKKEQLVFTELSSMICQTRLSSVLSHGEVKMTDHPRKIAGMLQHDAISEFTRERGQFIKDNCLEDMFSGLRLTKKHKYLSSLLVAECLIITQDKSKTIKKD